MLALIAAAAAVKLALPAPGPVTMDYLATSGAQVWVPAGNTGKVFVLEQGAFRAVSGFPTAKGRGDRLMGPSSVSVGRGRAYVGNRGDSTICAIDAKTLEKKECASSPSMPDVTFYVERTNEVWVTTPREKSLQIFSLPLRRAAKLEVPGEPEGYAVDERRGLVFTNLEDKDRTLVIDAKARKVVRTFSPGCGEAGPRGLAVDAARGLLLVACTDGVVALDEQSGERKGRLETGGGVDNIDYLPSAHRLYVAAGKAAKLTIADVADGGALSVITSTPIGQGCRVVVATEDGTAYAADSAAGALWVLEP